VLLIRVDRGGPKIGTCRRLGISCVADFRSDVHEHVAGPLDFVNKTLLYICIIDSCEPELFAIQSFESPQSASWGNLTRISQTNQEV
jgi:hypothetical protein